MPPPRIIPSTTSHKGEPLGATLDIFSRLGFHDLDLNLGHIVEGGVSVETVHEALDAGAQRVWIVSGGWCDFFDAEPQWGDTLASVDRQIEIARRLNVSEIRLFFGRLPREAYGASALRIAARNIALVADRHPAVTFMFENHGTGASSQPEVCRDILREVNRPNVRLVYDPVNFEFAGIGSLDALAMLLPLVGHVHLKGLDGREFCEFGSGNIDLTPALRMLMAHGYRGKFTVEYEGRFDRTLRLYRSVQRAERVLHELAGSGP
jgi:sugar phosphate isomerase/epimerase